MAGKVAINGLGRIGRATLKIVLDIPELELVASSRWPSVRQESFYRFLCSCSSIQDKEVGNGRFRGPGTVP